MDYDAIVIGAGVGGCAAAAAMAGAGMKVLVLERMDRVGGRCTTSSINGFKIDIGSHWVMRTDYGPFEEACRRVGMDGKVRFYHGKKFMFQYKDMKFTLNMETIIKTLSELLPSNALKTAGRVVPIISSLFNPIYERYNNISCKEFVETYTNSLAVKDILNHFGFILTWTPYWETSAGEFMKIVAESIVGGILSAAADGLCCCGYPLGGLISYPDALCEGIRNRNGEVITGVGVKRVILENGKVAGVETAEGHVHSSRIVVSNAGIKETVLELTGREQFNADYAAKIEALKPSWAVYCLRLSLDEKVMDADGAFTIPTPDVEKFDRIVWEEHKVPRTILPPLMITSPSNMDPSLAPEGRQLMIIIGGCSYDPEENWAKWEERALESANYTFPGLEDHIIWKDFLTPGRYRALGEQDAPLIGIAQSYDQVGHNRPSSKSPIEGLYYVGCEAGMGVSGIGMELGTESGLQCADYIVRHKDKVMS